MKCRDRRKIDLERLTVETICRRGRQGEDPWGRLSLHWNLKDEVSCLKSDSTGWEKECARAESREESPRRGAQCAERWGLFSESCPEQFSSSWLKWMPMVFASWKSAYYILTFRCVCLCVRVLDPLPGGSAGKESACNVGDLGSIPGMGRTPGEGKGYPLQHSGLEKSPWGRKESDTIERLSLSPGNRQVYSAYYMTLAPAYKNLCWTKSLISSGFTWVRQIIEDASWVSADPFRSGTQGMCLQWVVEEGDEWRCWLEMCTSYPLLPNRFPQTKQLTTMPTHQLTSLQVRTGPWCGRVLLRMSQGQIRTLAEAVLLS